MRAHARPLAKTKACRLFALVCACWWAQINQTLGLGCGLNLKVGYFGLFSLWNFTNNVFNFTLKCQTRPEMDKLRHPILELFV